MVLFITNALIITFLIAAAAAIIILLAAVISSACDTSAYTEADRLVQSAIAAGWYVRRNRGLGVTSVAVGPNGWRSGSFTFRGETWEDLRDALIDSPYRRVELAQALGIENITDSGEASDEE